MNLKRGFTLLEILLTVIVLTVGVFAIGRAFSVGLFASADVQNIDTALNIAQARMEEIKDTPFAGLADSGPAADPNFASFTVSVSVAEGQNPMQVDVTVSWPTVGGTENVVLTTLVADY